MTSTSPSARPRRIEIPLVAWLLVPVAWLLARPYRGIRHDGVLYTAQVLRHLWPATFNRDVFFAYGSQDAFSVFSVVGSWLFNTFGVAATESIVPLIAQAGLLLAAYGLLHAGRATALEKWLALIALAGFQHLYDGVAILAFAEPFLTARTFAEPLCVLAVLAMVSKRWVLSTVAVGLAALMHPLVTLPVLIVGWIYLSMNDRRWWFAALLILVPVALAIAKILPFAQLFERYDDIWWKNVKDHNPVVLLSNWRAAGWQTLTFDLVLLALASRVMGGRIGQVCVASVCATLALVTISMLGSDLGRDVLITCLQLWRVMWWTHFLSIMLLPMIVMRMYSQRPHGALIAGALLAGAVTLRWDAGWAFELWLLAALFLHWRGVPLSKPITTAMQLASALSIVGVSVVVGLAGFQVVSSSKDAGVASQLLALATTPLIIGGSALLLLVGLRGSRGIVALTMAAAVLLAAVAVRQWDQRDDWQRRIEAGLERPHPFQRLIGEHQQVYWHDDPLATWLLLRRPSYYSPVQWAGQLFNRGTMETLAKRGGHISVIQLQQMFCDVGAKLNGTPEEPTCSPTPELVQDICETQFGLDFMVFDVELPRGLVDRWTFTSTSGASKTYYLYDCNRLRHT
jgi:hypothetical protein